MNQRSGLMEFQKNKCKISTKYWQAADEGCCMYTNIESGHHKRTKYLMEKKEFASVGFPASSLLGWCRQVLEKHLQGDQENGRSQS